MFGSFQKYLEYLGSTFCSPNTLGLGRRTCTGRETCHGSLRTYIYVPTEDFGYLHNAFHMETVNLRSLTVLQNMKPRSVFSKSLRCRGCLKAWFCFVCLYILFYLFLVYVSKIYICMQYTKHSWRWPLIVQND